MIHTVRPRPLPAAAAVPLLLSGLTRAFGIETVENLRVL